MAATEEDVFLVGVRVLEVGGELVEYTGKLLAGMGADVIKIEPPDGEVTRTYGPFYEDVPGTERSLYFWHYNFGKRGITLDLETDAGKDTFRRLVADADVVLDGRPRGYFAEHGFDYAALKAINPRVVVSRCTPFGDDGPYADFKGSDLVHLALGGVVMNNGYDPDPNGFYELPPMAPQMWQSYQIAGEMAAIGIMGALYYREESGEGQFLSTPIHSSVAAQTETDLPDWVYNKAPHYRRTGQHSQAMPVGSNSPMIARTKDGRWLYPMVFGNLGGGPVVGFQRHLEVLEKYGMADDLGDPKYLDEQYLADPTVAAHIADVVARFIGRFMFDRDIWRDFQDAGQVWAPERRPEENTTDSHWRSRQTFLEVERPELGKTFTEIGAKWMCLDVSWRTGPRSPLLGEHTDEVLKGLEQKRPILVAVRPGPERAAVSKHGKPFSLTGVRFIDLSWLLASAGAGRYLAAMGADVIRVEHKSRLDFLRFAPSIAPPGGRAERDAATGPIVSPRPESINRGGFFLEINSGKRSIGLNVKHPRGKELLAQLLSTADVVAEGFSPGTMDRMGFGYERMKELNPAIVYVQQSGMGQLGTYGQMRSYGPLAAAFSGLTEMSGLPEPYAPAGIGYSYLDWFGAYNMATAIMAGIYRQKMTGKGCWIDSSQVESGTYLVGSSILDYSANGRAWQRYGNRSPYKPAAPHGVFRARGNDRWIAISCFTDDEWKSLLGVLGTAAWEKDSRFATLEQRVANQDALEPLVNAATETWEPYELMTALQAAGVPAGVCQTAEDRVDYDPQLKHLNWQVELMQSEIGVWPVKEFPTVLSETPAYMGGVIDRHGPSYAEDNEYVYGELLGFSTKEIRELEADDVI